MATRASDVAIDVHWFLPVVNAGTFTERWPYGPGAAFHHDLAIEIDGTYRAAAALAVVSGTLIVLPDSGRKTCGVVLLPNADVMKALGADSIGELAFFLGPLDLADLVRRFTDVVTEKLPRGVTKAEQVENLKAGKLPLIVGSGEEIAVIAPETAGVDRGLARFEVIFAPRRGSYVGKGRAITYAQRLVDPANRKRRLDPMSFYYRVKRTGVAAKIAAAHTNHAFWTSNALTRRGLIEVRDEYDRPFATTIDLEVAPASPTSVVLRDAMWAHHEVAAPGTSGLVDCTFRKQSWRLTRLPTSGRSFAEQTNQDEVPFHFPVQTLEMGTATSSDSWFVTNDAPLSFYTERNKVEPLVDGIAAFKAMVSFIKRVRQPDQFVWLAGWWGDDSFELIAKDATTTLDEMFKACDAANADVRVILWDQVGRRVNKTTVRDVNSLPSGNGIAILDNQTRKFGSHHQKFMVVYIKADDCVAFCGGIDVNTNRIDNPDHAFKRAYHDVHAQLQGPVIRDVMRLFIERWNNHDDVVANPAKQLQSSPNRVINDTSGDCFVQVTRTIPKGTHGTVSQGVQGTFKAVRRAIQRAQHYIYIEDQYLAPYWGHVPFDPQFDVGDAPGSQPGIVQDLLDALKRIRFLIIVVPNHMKTPQMLYRRHEFLEALSRAAGEHKAKIHVYYLKRKKRSKTPPEAINDTEEEEVAMMNPGLEATIDAQREHPEVMGVPGTSGSRAYPNEIYVHTKVWIVDDVYVKCGSMNINRRGFTFDTEADFHAVDGALTRGKRRAALAFRQALFAEHTRLAPDDVPDDPEDVIAWWLDRAKTAGRVGNFDWSQHALPIELQPQLPALDKEWQSVIDPDGRV